MSARGGFGSRRALGSWSLVLSAILSLLLDSRWRGEAAASEERPQGLVVETNMKIPPDTDCNGNGIPDRADRRYGSTLDLDNNGWDDNCDRDSAMARFIASGWRSRSTGTAPYLAVMYEPSRRRILINYSLPLSSQMVRIVATRRSDDSCVVLRSGRQARGAHSLTWEPVEEDGSPTPSGQWRLSFLVDEQSFSKPVA